MSDLPPELTYGKVVGRLILAVADAGDAGRNPDAVAAVGTVAFTPKNPNVKVTTPGGEATVVLQKVTCTLDGGGYVTDPQGVAGVWLVTGVYTVAYSITNAAVTSHDIAVLATHTDVAPLDLTTAIPAGTPVTPSQYAELSSRLDAVEAGGGGGGVTDHGALTGLGDDDHTQYLTQARGDARYYTETEVDAALAGKQAAGSYAASVHAHATVDVTGLDAALAGKQAAGSYAAASHTHAEADVTGLTAALAGKAASTHTHAQADVTGLVSALAGKAVNTLTITAGTGLTGGGDLTANRTLAVDFAGAGVTTAGKVVNANDARLSDSRTPLAHNHAGADITSGTVAYARLPIGTTAGTVAAGDDSRIGKIGGTVSVSGTPTAGQVPVASSGTTAAWGTPAGGGSTTVEIVDLGLSSSPSIATGTVQSIMWNTEAEDTSGYHSTVSNTDRVTIPAGLAGVYLVSAVFTYSPGASAPYGQGQRALIINKNGTLLTNATVQSINAVTNDPTPVQLATTVRLAVGDYLTFQGWHNHGSTLTIDYTRTRLTVTRLGA